MTALLISVRCAAEARLACRHGVDIVDLKEPRAGSLGCVDVRVAEEVTSAAAGSARLSLAMGELRDWQPQHFRGWPLAKFQFAKIGLAGMRRADWCKGWWDWKDSLPTSVAAVAVAYVDAQEAAAPRRESVVEAAVEAGLHYLLFDTFRKDRGRLTDFVSPGELARLAAELRRESVTLAAAGRLTPAIVPELVAMGIPIVALRGAACQSGRSSALSATKLRQLRALVNAAQAADSH